MKSKKILIIQILFLSTVCSAFGQTELKHNNIIAGASLASTFVDDDAPFAFLLHGGYEYVFGNTERDGLFVALGGGIRAGYAQNDYKSSLDLIVEHLYDRTLDLFKYDDAFLGPSISVRPAMEVGENLFLFVGGETGLMYHHLKTGIRQEEHSPTHYYNSNFIKMMYAFKIGLQYKKLGFNAGIINLNTQNEINKIVKKYSSDKESDNILLELEIFYCF